MRPYEDDATAEMIAETARHVLDGGSVDRNTATTLSQVQGDSLIDLFYWANKFASVLLAAPSVFARSWPPRSETVPKIVPTVPNRRTTPRALTLAR